MGFKRLKFTKLWTRHTDFPTVETNESQVRADMQLLHDETSANLNGLMSDLEAPTGAASLGAKTPEGENSTVQVELDRLYESQLKAGALPAAGETDQVLTKTSDESYATGWKSLVQLLTPLLGKPNLMASLGDGGRLETSQIPDDLAKLLQHCWKRTANTSAWTTQEGGRQRVKLCGNSGDTDGCETTVSYGTKISVSETGALSLSGTTGTVAVNYYGLADGNTVLPGRYFKQGNGFFHVPSDCGLYHQKEWDSSNDEYDYFVYVTAVPVSAVQIQPGSDYVCAPERSAYPDYGDQDSFHYEYTGTVLENVMAVPKMACGSYVGTGTYGSGNPCTVALDFTPMFFIAVDTDYYTASHLVIYAGYASGSRLVFTKGDGTFSWYHTYGDDYQCNTNGHVYAWFAIGG